MLPIQLEKYLHSLGVPRGCTPDQTISVLYMGLYVSDGSHTQYTYMISPGAQPRDAPGPCKYFLSN